MSETNEYFNNEYLGVMMQEADDLQHYGTKRHSGRYPWGSGDDGMQRAPSEVERTVAEYDALRAKGMADVDIAAKLGITTTKMRTDRTLAKAERDQRNAEGVNVMLKRGMKIPEIATAMGLSESSVRNWIGKDPNTVNSKRQIDKTADALADAVKRSTYVDIGTGVERQLGISKQKLTKWLNLVIMKSERFGLNS